jgi:tetratricopeptide (TPR) repeat protein
MEDYKGAEKVLEELIDAEKVRNNQYSLKTASLLNHLARVLERNHEYKKAEEASMKAYELVKTHFPNAQSKICDSAQQSELSDAAWLTAEIHAFEKRKSSLAEADLAFQFDKAASTYANITLIRDFDHIACIYAALGEDSQADSFFKKSMAAAAKGTPTVNEKIVFSIAASQYAAFLRKHNRIPEAQKIETSVK